MTHKPPAPETETDHLAGWMGHLVELRTRIVRASVAVLVVFLILFYWRNQIFGFPLMLASLPEGARMIFRSDLELFCTGHLRCGWRL